MKKHTLNMMAVIIALLLGLPAQGQDYLKIYFKDGRTERHLMSLIEQIYTTRYDSEGAYHSTYQMQRIVMADTTYSYYINDIDSVTFKKVDENQIKTDLVNVTEFIQPIFEVCTDSVSMSQHLDEISNLEGVEDVWLTASDLIVHIRDWRLVFYHFPHAEPIPDNNDLLAMSSIMAQQNLAKSVAHADNFMASVPNKASKVAILNQQSKDESRSYYIDCFDGMRDMFNNMGFEATCIESEDLSCGFFKKEMYQYDIIYLNTHGSYHPGDKKHWTVTGEEISVDNAPWWWDQHDDDNNPFDNLITHVVDLGEAATTVVWEKRTGFHPENEDSVQVWYYVISEDYFTKKKDAHFNKDHNTIFFNGACESMKGDGVLEREYNGVGGLSFSGSSSMARVFTARKNLDVYLGYNEISNTYKDYLAANYFFKYLLNGYSEEGALYRLQQEHNTPDLAHVYHCEDLLDQYNVINDGNNMRMREWVAHLDDIRATEDARGMFIVKTSTGVLTSQEADGQYNANGKITIKGYTTMRDMGDTNIKCGFRFGDDPNLRNYIEVTANNAHAVSGNSLGNVEFSFELEPSPGQTMYYQAFTTDDIHYNLSDNIETFTVSAGDLENYWGEDYKEVCSFTNTNGKKVILEKKIDLNDTRTNADGSVFYRTTLAINMNATRYVLTDNIYTTKAYTNWQLPCMVVDRNSQQLRVFSISKMSGNDYRMEGFNYQFDLNSSMTTTETVFSGKNWGWHSFFESFSVLRHFSYAGYYMMTSTRNSDGTWSNQYNDFTWPDDASNMCSQHPICLVLN